LFVLSRLTRVLIEIGIALTVSRILRKGFPLISENVDTSYTYTLVPDNSAAIFNAFLLGPFPKKGLLLPVIALLFLARVSILSFRPVNVILILDRVNSEIIELSINCRPALLVSTLRRGINVDKYQFSRSISLSELLTSRIVIEK
jgi:hypothetical protein